MSACDIQTVVEDGDSIEATMCGLSDVKVVVGEGGTISGSSVDWNQVLHRPVFISNETLQGVIDGTNTVFQANATFAPSTVSVYLNGLKLHPTHYQVIAPNQIQLEDPPYPGDFLLIDYIK